MGIEKSLIIFLINHLLLDSLCSYWSWVETYRVSNHFPIFLELGLGVENSEAPFKYNLAWEMDKSFKKFVNGIWKRYNPILEDLMSVQFIKSLKLIKDRDSLGYRSSHIQA